jgi:glycosyltransferase involved in cell wall biosynthesis
MKIVYNCHVPYGLAHGGMQVQVEKTKGALDQLGVETEYLQWWNPNQRGDILHHFGHWPLPLIQLAQKKGWKVAITLLLTEQCNRSRTELWWRKLLIRTALATLPGQLKSRLPWAAYRQADRMLVSLHSERWILEHVYGVAPAAIAVVPYGLSETFLKAEPATRIEDTLICTGRIGPTKNCVELAELARAAEVPILFVGKPFDYRSAYWERFRGLIDNRYVKHHEHIATENGLVEMLRRARGYVLLSRYENWCLAAHEAAACGLPVLLPDQPWSRERFGNQASYFPKKGNGGAQTLRRFYDQSAKMPAPRLELSSWLDVGRMIRKVYDQMLSDRPG